MQQVFHFFFPRPLYVGTLMNGSSDAGMPDRGDKKVTMATSAWTNLVVNLETGNHLVTADVLSVPTASGLPMSVQLVHNSMNASIDVGIGKGWMTNLHSCVEEDGQSGDITYMDATGAQHLFDYDSQSQTYTNPKGFAGKMTKEVDGSYTLQSLGHTKLTFGSNGKLTSISETCGTSPDSVNISYDGNGNPIAITDSLSNRSISLDYNGNGKLYQISDPLSNTWEISYNGSNQLIGLQQPEDTIQNPPPTPPSCSFSYDGNNLITGHDDFLGNNYTIGYEGSSPFKVTSWTDPASNQTTFAYASASSPYDKKTTVTDAEDIDIEYYFGATSQQLEKIQQFDGTDTLKIEMAYDGTTGYQTSSIDAYGNTTTLSYDSVGHVTQITPPAGAAGQYTKTFTYSTPVSIDSVLEETEETVTDQVDATTSFLYTDNNNPCLPTSITNPLGQTTSQTYNSHGQITSLTQPTTGGTKTTSYTYSPSTGDLTQVTDPLSNTTSYTYNPAGYISTIARREGGTTAVSNKTITRNSFNLISGTSDSVTGLTSSYAADANGAETSSSSEGDCDNSSAYTDGQGNTQASSPVLDIQPWNPPFQGNVYASSVPYRPHPYSTTNSRGETTIFTYYDNGSVYTATNHIGQTSTMVYDDFGRLETNTNHAGKTTTYDYDLNSQVTSIQVEGEGTTSYSYDNVGHVTQVSDPIQGTISYTRNLRGDVTADENGTYQLDLLGRPQSLTYYGGAGIEIWTYTPDQKVASHTQNGGTDTYTYDAVGNLTSKNSTTFSYSGTSLLGIPSSQSGGGDSYSFTYDNRHYLSTLQNTTLGQSFTYGWSNAHELTNLSYPNGTNLTQVYTQKYNNNVMVKNSGLQTLLSGQVTRDGTTHQISQYDYSVTDGGMNTLAEIATISYHATGTLKGKINTVSYNTGKPTVTYGYDANTGRTNSLQIAGQGTYNIAYTPEGQVNTITYPNQSQEVYSYTGPKGQVSSIQYPNGTTMSMTWTAQDRVNTISETNGGSSVQNTFTYTPTGDIANWTKVVNGTPQETWSFQYGPQGIEGATCITPSGNITQDYCTDPSGRPLAMYYTDQRGGIGQTFTGMLYFHYDNFGNTAMLTDASGVPQVLYQYDLRTSLFTSINANNIRNPFTSLGEEGAITDSLTLTNNVDWTVYKGGVFVSNEYHILAGSATPRDLSQLLLEDILGGQIDMCCFERCWKEETKDKGSSINGEGNWVPGGQFMSGNWEEDLEKFVTLSAKEFNIQAGQGWDIILALLSIEWSWLRNLVGGGESIARYYNENAKPTSATVDQMLANWNMGPDFDEAADIFWSIVSDCSNRCRKKSPGTPGPRPGLIGPGDYVNSIGNSGSVSCFN